MAFYDIETGMKIADLITKSRDYEIVKVTRYFKGGARVTREKTLRFAKILDVINLCNKQGDDVKEMIDDIIEMGCATIKGYYFIEL